VRPWLPLLGAWIGSLPGEQRQSGELRALIVRAGGAEHYGEETRESAEAKGGRIIREGLERLGWPEAELIRRRKGHSAKLQIAPRLRLETAMTLERIAKRLAVGTKTHLSRLLYSQGRQRGKERRNIYRNAAPQRLSQRAAPAARLFSESGKRGVLVTATLDAATKVSPAGGREHPSRGQRL
jgi:hypothetical protein